MSSIRSSKEASHSHITLQTVNVLMPSLIESRLAPLPRARLKEISETEKIPFLDLVITHGTLRADLSRLRASWRVPVSSMADALHHASEFAELRARGARFSDEQMNDKLRAFGAAIRRRDDCSALRALIDLVEVLQRCPAEATKRFESLLETLSEGSGGVRTVRSRLTGGALTPLPESGGEHLRIAEGLLRHAHDRKQLRAFINSEVETHGFSHSQLYARKAWLKIWATQYIETECHRSSADAKELAKQVVDLVSRSFAESIEADGIRTMASELESRTSFAAEDYLKCGANLLQCLFGDSHPHLTRLQGALAAS